MNKTEARDLILEGFKSLTASSQSYQEKVHLDFITLGKLLLQGLKQAFEATSRSITIMLSSP